MTRSTVLQKDCLTVKQMLAGHFLLPQQFGIARRSTILHKVLVNLLLRALGKFYNLLTGFPQQHFTATAGGPQDQGCCEDPPISGDFQKVSHSFALTPAKLARCND
jgi:hypothetical protein